jgi:hypothetical protein
MKISDIVTFGNKLTVIDDRGNELSHRFLSYGEELVGFSADIIVIQDSGGRATIFDPEFDEISHRYLVTEQVTRVVGDRVLTKCYDATITYDRDFDEISRRHY